MSHKIRECIRSLLKKQHNDEAQFHALVDCAHHHGIPAEAILELLRELRRDCVVSLALVSAWAAEGAAVLAELQEIPA